MRNVFLAAVAAYCLTAFVPATAQEMTKVSWSAFGVSFNVPTDLVVEDDSEEGYIVSNDTYYVNVQILDGEAMDKNAMATEIKQVADDDQLKNQSPVQQFDLPQFYGAQLKGMTEGEYCLYNYLMSKDDSGGFFVTIIFKDKEDVLPYKIIKSFKLAE